MTAPTRVPHTWSEFGIEVDPSGQVEQDTTCPKCSPTRKKSRSRCLGVNLEKFGGSWWCHHCGWHGTLNSGEDGSRDPYDGRYGPTRQKTYQSPKSLPPTPPAISDEPPESEEELAWDRAVSFLVKRGISEETARAHRITVVQQYMRDANNGEGGQVWSIALPYYDGETHVNTKYRAIDEKLFQMSGGAKRIFYGMNDLIDATSGFVVEGEFDKLAMAEAGFPNVLSVPDGAPSPGAKNYDSKFDFMDDWAVRFEGIKKWIIAVDNDEPGRVLGAELARRFGPDRCWFVDWAEASTPEKPIKDANDALLLWGRDGFRDRMRAITKRWPVEGLFNVVDFKTAIEDRYRNGPPPSFSTGWPKLDKGYKVRGGMTTLVTGVPNIGKSTFLNALVVNLMQHHDFRVAICSPEWLPVDDQVQAMLKIATGKPFDYWHPDRMTPNEINYWIDWLDQRCMFINPEVPTIPAILERAEIAISRIGARGLVIDPWSEIETSHAKPAGTSQTDWIGQCLRDLRRFARSRKVHVWLVAHPTKIAKGTDGEYPVVDMYDISGSAHFANMADMIISLYRQSTSEDQMEVHVQKARFAHSGRRGEIIPMWFDHDTGRFSDDPHFLSTGTRDPWSAGATTEAAD